MRSNGNGNKGEERADVKSEVAQALIEAMKEGNTPWQKPWSSAAMRPTNKLSANAYRGINRALLSIAGAGRSSNEWLTYRQAAEAGWQVRKGEKGTMIVKVVELGGGEAQSIADREEAKAEKELGRAPRALRRYWVFNTEQIDGIPRGEAAPAGPAFELIERAEGVMQALIEKTGLVVMHGNFEPCYIPPLDEIRLPRREAFNASGAAGYFSVALHEAAHSSLHERRLARRDAIGKRWGDQAYALEELRAEICSAILASETGVPMSAASIANHAAYLNSWVKAIEGDPMAIFTAAKDADLMAEYLLGLEAQLRAERRNDAWVRNYERCPSISPRWSSSALSRACRPAPAS